MPSDSPRDPDDTVLWGRTDGPGDRASDVDGPTRPVLPSPSGPTTPPSSPGAPDPFAEESLLSPRRPAGRPGLRGLVDRVLGRDPVDPQEDPAVGRCRRPVPGGRRIAVISRKGGVGKTTTTLMLGHTLAAARQDRVLAIDANPDAGTLGHRVAPQTAATVTDALTALDGLRGYPDARRLTSQAPSRLEVLASPADPQASRALTGADYRRLLDGLDPHYSVVLCDTGTGIIDDATQGVLHAVDQVVVVAGPALDTARTAALTLDWLATHGHAAAVADAVVVINAVGEVGRVDVDAIITHFYERVRAVHLVPWDRQLEAGAVTDPQLLAPDTRAAWLEVAASVADGFALPSPRDMPGR